MKYYKTFIISVSLCCMMILIESCSSSILVDVWKDPTYREEPLKKILILAIRKDPIQRRIWEDAFVLEFSKYGVNATSSYHLYPDNLPDTTQIISVIQEKGYDGILVTRLLLSETKTYSVMSTITTERITKYDVFRKRYDTYYHDVFHPGYEESYTIDRRAIDVWAIKGIDRVIWSATSNSPERNTVQAVQQDIADLVIPELVRNAIIRKVK